MKKLFALIVAGCFVYTAEAQFSAGQKMIGGQLGIGYTSTETPGVESRSFLFSLSPSFSKFVSPTAFNTVGIMYDYIHQRSGINTNDATLFDSNTFGLYIGHTKLAPLGSKFYFSMTGTAGAGFSTQRTRSVFSSNKTDGDGYNVYLRGGIGLLYQLNQRFLLSTQLNNLVSLSYQHTKNTSYNGNNPPFVGRNNSLAFSTGLNGFSLNNVQVGVNYLLKK